MRIHITPRVEGKSTLMIIPRKRSGLPPLLLKGLTREQMLDTVRTEVGKIQVLVQARLLGPLP